MMIISKSTEEAPYIRTNAMYFSNFCIPKDLCRIYRMWLKRLDSTVGRDAPREVKEREYDAWLSEEFDPNEWDKTGIKEEKVASGYLLDDKRKKVIEFERYYKTMGH